MSNPILSESSDELTDDYVITPRASAKFNHSISLIFAGFFDKNPEHPRDPARWTTQHVSLTRHVLISEPHFQGVQVGIVGSRRVLNPGRCQPSRIRRTYARPNGAPRILESLAALHWRHWLGAFSVCAQSVHTGITGDD